MALGIDCPHCGVAAVAVAKKTWFMRGFLFFARYGSQTHVGCRRCVNMRIFYDLLASLVLGWWCFPWGLGTPLVVIQNLILLLLPNSSFDASLDQVLASVGVRRNDIEVDPRGFTAEEKRLYKIAVSVLAGAIWADGDATTAEYETAVGILTSLADGKISEPDAARGLEMARDTQPDIAGLPWDFRVLLLHMAADTVASDGRIAGAEATFLHDLASRLELDRDDVESILSRLSSVAGGEALRRQDPDFVRACTILGVEPEASVTDIRKRYRSVMMKVHPDQAGPNPEHQTEAHRIAQDVNWAYEYVLRSAA
jgi:DnaJ-domain-containing protein 1